MSQEDEDRLDPTLHEILLAELSRVPGATLDRAAGEVLIPLGQERARVSTASLQAACRGQAKSTWRQITQDWLGEVMRNLFGASQQVEVNRLRVQAVPRGNEAPTGLSAEFNAAFDLVAVEDRRGSVRHLTQADLDALGLSPEAAIQTALEQTIGNVLVNLEVQSHPLPGGEAVLMAGADGVPYVSAGITSINQLAGMDLPFGAIVGVPRHSTLLILPVTSRQSLTVVGIVNGFVESMYDGAADSCSRELYWFVDDDVHSVGIAPGDDGRPQLVLSPEAAAVADRLPG